MPQNPFSVWSEIIDLRNEKEQQKYALTDADIDVIERIFRGEHAGIHLHKLKGTHPAAISAYVNDTRRLIFIPKGSTLALVEILLDHKYPNLSIMQPGVAERLYQKPWNDIKDQAIEYEPIISIKDFTPNPDYVYQAPRTCVSYHQKFITLDGNQSGSFTLPTPAVIIGDPGSGKSIISSAMMKENLCAPAFIESGKKIVYFTESSGLSEKMEQAWLLDHPLTARQPEANLLLFADYEKILREYGPPTIQDKVRVGQVEFEAFMQQRLSNKRLSKLHPFIKTPEFSALISTLYHEFQIITVCVTKERYLAPDRKANLPHVMRDWAYSEYERYLKNLETDRKFDPNLLLWEPNEKPFARVYNDEALCASPAINAMMHRLADANILYFADPNQENTRERSDLDFILSELGVNGKPATKHHLGVTYRLAPTMANVSNDLLILKQNVNGGKNEKNQSSQIACKADEHALPGTLQWVELAKCDQLVEDLNRHNEVFVVITYPEYIEKAQTLFGPKAYVCTIEEARGQEFDKGVFYRITDPNPSSSSSTRKEIKSGLTLLQQIGKILSQMDEQLECKQHLAKAGEGNRHFEAYFNSIFIALTRIIRSGYFVEDGKPEENEFHRRLKLSIDKHMSGVVIEEPIATVSMEILLEKAKQDLSEGNVAQAKAGFLRAGVDIAGFETALKADEQRKAELIKSIIDDRNEQPDADKKQHVVVNEATEQAFPAAPLNEQDLKFILSSIAEKSKNKLCSALKKMTDVTQLLTRTLDNNGKQVSLLQMIYRQANLGDVLYAYLNRLKNKKNISALFSQTNFNTEVMVADVNGVTRRSPLIFVMVMTPPGKSIIKLLNQRSHNTLFQQLTTETLFGLVTQKDGKVKQSLLSYALSVDVPFFYDLLIQNEARASSQTISSWIEPSIDLDRFSRNKLSLIMGLVLLSSDPEKTIAEAAVAAVKFIFNLNDGQLYSVDDPIKLLGLNAESNVLDGACSLTLFDLMLTHDELSVLLLPFMTDRIKAIFTPSFFFSPFPKFNTMKYIRLDYFMKLDGLRKVALDCLKNAVIPTEYQAYYNKCKAALYGLTEGGEAQPRNAANIDSADQPVKPSQSSKKSEPEILREILSSLASVNKAKQLFESIKLDKIRLIKFLDSPDYKRLLVMILQDNVTETHIKAANNFSVALPSLNAYSMMNTDSNKALSYEVPILYYLIDRHLSFFTMFLKNVRLDSNGEFNNTLRHSNALRYTTPYRSMTFQEDINLITLLGILEPGLFYQRLTKNTKLIQCVKWTISYAKEGEPPKSVLSNLAHRATKQQFDSIFNLLASHKAQLASCITLDNLFLELRNKELGVYCDFTALIVNEAGPKLLYLCMNKIVQHPLFDNFFADSFISQIISHDLTPDREKLFQSRFHLMCMHECLQPIIIRIISKAVLPEATLTLLTKCSVSSDTTIASFHWSALSTLLSCPEQLPVIATLIETHPDLMRQLQPDAWHAPVADNNKFNLPKENYLLMHVVIRTLVDTDIGEFFKTHYQDAYRAAAACIKLTIRTPAEKEFLNDVNLALPHKKPLNPEDQIKEQPDCVTRVGSKGEERTDQRKVAGDSAISFEHIADYIKWMQLLKQPNAATAFSESTPDQRTKFAHAMDHDTFRQGFIEYIRLLPTKDQINFVCEFFKINAINQKIWPETKPKQSSTVLFVLLHSDIAKAITATLYHHPNSHYYYKNYELEFWLKPFHQWDEADPASTFSHLDVLFLLQPLVSIAKLVINHRLKSFIETCFNEEYLFARLSSPNRVTSRLTLLLTTPLLQPMFLFWHRQRPLALPLLAAALSNPELSIDRLRPDPQRNILTTLNETAEGRQLLQQFKKMPELFASLDEPMQAVVNNASNLPSPPSVVTQGVFAANQPNGEMSLEAALSFISQSPNSEVMATSKNQKK